MHSPFYFLKYFSRNPNCITRSLYFGYGKVSQVAKKGEIMLLFTGRHFWNRKCRKKTWWQQEFAVFKCEATANSVTGHVCVNSNKRTFQKKGKRRAGYEKRNMCDIMSAEETNAAAKQTYSFLAPLTNEQPCEAGRDSA